MEPLYAGLTALFGVAAFLSLAATAITAFDAGIEGKKTPKRAWILLATTPIFTGLAVFFGSI